MLLRTGLGTAILIALGLPNATAALAPEEKLTTVRPLQISVGDLVFEARAAGPADGPLVLLLHGFPQTSFSYVRQLEHLAGLGFYAVAPDQRGYSPGARPSGVESYAMSHLVRDVAGMADALGRERFHLVGHDWGGAVAWVFAGVLPHRLESLTVLSTPHPGAFQGARRDPASDQAERSSYFAEWSKPGAEKAFLADDAAQLRAIWGDLQPEAVAAYLDVLGDPAALRAALHWYGALQAAAPPPTAPRNDPAPAAAPASPPVRVRTLYAWGEDDSAFGRDAAEGTAAFVTGPYRFEVLEDAGHWLTETAPDRVNRLLVEHLRAPPGEPAATASSPDLTAP